MDLRTLAVARCSDMLSLLTPKVVFAWPTGPPTLRGAALPTDEKKTRKIPIHKSTTFTVVDPGNGAPRDFSSLFTTFGPTIHRQPSRQVGDNG